MQLNSKLPQMKPLFHTETNAQKESRNKIMEKNDVDAYDVT